MDEPFLSRRAAEYICDSLSIDAPTDDELITLFRSESEIQKTLPMPQCAIDERDSLPVIFTPGREKRPNTHQTPHTGCPVCEGRLTRILDIASLDSERFCIMNKNLYPIVWPYEEPGGSSGLHFLLWPSNRHSERFHTMSPGDQGIVFSRLAALEKRLLHGHFWPQTRTTRDDGHQFWAGIIKNEGSPVGGSVKHDHFQAALVTEEPLKLRQDRLFFEERKQSPGEAALRDSGTDYTIMTEGAWSAFVPKFMRRPYDVMIAGTDMPDCLHHLSQPDLQNLAVILGKSISLMEKMMIQIERTPAWNIIFHNGGFGSLYVECLPYSQPLGGFEQLGLFACQADPIAAANTYRSLLRRTHAGN